MATAEEREIRRFWHTLDDIARIAERRGSVTLYHGAPDVFAEAIVREGVRLAASGIDIERSVAAAYNIPFVEYRERVVSGGYGNEVARLSTAPAAIAIRWAKHFRLGEVLTSANARARMYVAARERARERQIALDDALEELYELSQQQAQRAGRRWTYDNAPDLLGIPDEFIINGKRGAIVAFDVDTRALPEHVVMSAQSVIDYVYEEGETETVEAWNTSYIDIKVESRHLRNPRIVGYVEQED